MLSDKVAMNNQYCQFPSAQFYLASQPKHCCVKTYIALFPAPGVGVDQNQLKQPELNSLK